MKALLQSVSRSFYLTLRALPPPLREPIGLAYLLARATDTIADTTEIAASTRLTILPALGRVIAGSEHFSAIASPLRDFAAHQQNAAERNLIENLGPCIERLEAMLPADRQDIRALLQTIVRGQTLDLERFSEPSSNPQSLRAAADLDEYTYLVAGCVGEFWTKLGERHLQPFADRPAAEMMMLGVAYGKGLQLINILRDRGADLQAGRGYLPADELTAANEENVFARWLSKAESQISSGIDYSSALTTWRMRFATALPALIGARTLALLRAATPEARKRKIKVSRAAIRRLLFAGSLAAISPLALRVLFQRLQREPPRD